EQMGHSNLKMTLQYLQSLGKKVNRRYFHDLRFIKPALNRIQRIMKPELISPLALLLPPIVLLSCFLFP
ncbi:hypothetical protein, partial [Gracilimonas sp.]|uniref:hypothetical protein n=1 Tax=Gracilimonas sp. TaxID=1974203 RepID=UPI0028723B2E|nr:hypothetical protein [Gracilimonas sp.]